MYRTYGLISKPAYAFRYSKQNNKIYVFKGNIFYEEKHGPDTKQPYIYFVPDNSVLTKYVIKANEGEVDHYKLYLLDNGQDSRELWRAAAKGFFGFYTKKLNELIDKEDEIRRAHQAMLTADFVEEKESAEFVKEG